MEEPGVTMLMEDLVAVRVHLDREELLVELEGSLVEAVEMMNLTLVGEEEDLITRAQISKIHAVLKHLAMVM